MAAGAERAAASHVVTRAVKYSGTQHWTIMDLKSFETPNGNYIESHAFYMHATGEDSPSLCGDIKFWLRLYPRGIDKDSEDYVSLYVTGDGFPPEGLEVKVHLDLRNQKNAIDPWSYQGTHNLKSKGLMGWDKRLPRTCELECLDVEFVNECLVGEFVITCTVEHLGPPITRDISAGASGHPAPLPHAANTLQGGMISLYSSGELTDAEIIVTDGTIFKMHSVILAGMSPVFMKMFTGAFKEAGNLRVTIPDISASTCQVMIDHLYGKHLAPDITLDSMEQLLYASEKYELEGLKADCVYRLVTMISRDNVGRLLVLSDAFRAASLQAACEQYINANSAESVDAIRLRYIEHAMPEVKAKLEILDQLITTRK